MKVLCLHCKCDVDIKPSDRSLSCPHCHTFLSIERGESIQKATFPVRIPRSMVAGLLKRSLAENRLGEACHLDTLTLVYFPYWKLQGGQRVYGWPAAETVEYGLNSYELRPCETEIWVEPESGTDEIVPPDIYWASIWESRRGNDPGAEEDGILSLIYIPFYRVRFHYGTQVVTAYVEACSGSVQFNRLLPASFQRNRAFAVVAVLVLGAYGCLTFLLLQLTGMVFPAVIGCLFISLLFYPWLRKIVLD